MVEFSDCLGVHSGWNSLEIQVSDEGAYVELAFELRRAIRLVHPPLLGELDEGR